MCLSPRVIAALVVVLVVLKRVTAIPVAMPLRKPMLMAGVRIESAENLLVRIEADNGLVGWGEAASAPTMTGDLQAGMVAAGLAGAVVGASAVSALFAPGPAGAATQAIGALLYRFCT